MKFNVMLSEDEIKQICSVYPSKQLVTGFKKCPKDFSTLMPGHRPQTVQVEAGRKLLMNNPHSRLTSKMVSVFLSFWVPTVSNTIQQYIEEGKPKELAYIFAFAKTGQADIARIYFRAKEEEIEDAQIFAIIHGAKALSIEREEAIRKQESTIAQSQWEAEKEKHEKEVVEKDHIIQNLSNEMNTVKEELNQKIKQVEELLDVQGKCVELQQQFDSTNRDLSIAITQKKGLESTISKLQERIRNLQEDYESIEEKAQILAEEKAEGLKQLEACTEKLSEIEDKSAQLRNKMYHPSNEELRPIDMEDFLDCLQANFKSIGIDTSDDYYNVLMGYLSEILFQNKPIICNREVGITIASCVSNALCGSPSPMVIPYNKSIDNDELFALLATDSRVIVLDSFLGNSNETALLSVLKRIHGKIIFATIAYDRTMAYLPEEVLISCNYLNVDHIGEFCLSNCIQEESTKIDEGLFMPAYIEPKPKIRRLCKEILIQLDFQETYAEYLSTQMITERKFVSYLTYSILPYYIVVNKSTPYTKSERLQKYAGSTGNCAQKELLMRWFGDE